MPLKYGDKSYSFQKLVAKIMREKGWSKKKARAYVGGIEKRQKAKHKYRGT